MDDDEGAYTNQDDTADTDAADTDVVGAGTNAAADDDDDGLPVNDNDVGAAVKHLVAKESAGAKEMANLQGKVNELETGRKRFRDGVLKLQVIRRE